MAFIAGDTKRDSEIMKIAQLTMLHLLGTFVAVSRL